MAGKVTIGLASHLPRVTDINGSPPTGSSLGEVDEYRLCSLSGVW